MTIADGLMIGAVLLAPLVAIQVQKILEGWKEINERKERVFKTLMSTRARRLDHSHVEALNMIDLVFTGDPVCEKWTEFLYFSIRNFFISFHYTYGNITIVLRCFYPREKGDVK